MVKSESESDYLRKSFYENQILWQEATFGTVEEASKYAAELYSLVVTQDKSFQDLQPIIRELVADLYMQVCEERYSDNDLNLIIIMGGLHQQNPEKQRGSLFCLGFVMNKVMMSMKKRTEKPDVTIEDKALLERAFSFIGLLSCNMQLFTSFRLLCYLMNHLCL